MNLRENFASFQEKLIGIRSNNSGLRGIKNHISWSLGKIRWRKFFWIDKKFFSRKKI